MQSTPSAAVADPPLPSPPGHSGRNLIGRRVLIATHQPTRLGPAQFPGRRGLVVKENQFGGGQHGGLFYVMLDRTRRAKPREETFWGDELSLFSLEEACQDLLAIQDEGVLVAAHQAHRAQFSAHPDAATALAEAFTRARKLLLGF